MADPVQPNSPRAATSAGNPDDHDDHDHSTTSSATPTTNTNMSHAGQPDPQHDPQHDPQPVPHVQPVTRDIQRSLLGHENVDCVICSKLLYEPTTTPCGHTFCRDCLQRALSFASVCPNCRAIVHISFPAPVTTVLRNILEAAFPEEYEARRAESESLPAQSLSLLPNRIPIFPLNVVALPGQTFPMCIFEPRYRLMLSRIMSGSRKFGLIALRRSADGAAELCPVGTLLEVTDCRRLADGRSYINTIGRERFRVIDHTELDGYLVARTEIYQDTPVQSHESADTVQAYARRLLQELMNRNDRSSTGTNIVSALRRAGTPPTPDRGPTALGMWLADALITDNKERQRLLEMRNATDRLVEIATILENASQLSHPTGGLHAECVIQ